MTRKCKCLSCGLNFNTLKDKKQHKKDYPNGSCEGKFDDTKIMKSERDKSFDVSIPEAEAISMSQEKAKQELKVYKELIKTRKETYLKQMKDALLQLSKGRKIININEVMTKAGVREDGLPKLAIARADGTKVFLHRYDEGAISFSLTSNNWRLRKEFTIWIPKKTFPNFVRTEKERYGFEVYEALVPIIPAVFLPPHKLSNYWILWEVDKWAKVPIPPKDPILLKRINETTFAVLAVWDLTELERSITWGRR